MMKQRTGEHSKRLVVVGGGFAGVWSALAAARRRRELELTDAVAVTVVSPDEFLGIRPRFYEDDLTRLRVPLSRLLPPVGIEHLATTVTGLDIENRVLHTPSGAVAYDALIVATGSELMAPALHGATFLHNVDTFGAAEALALHLGGLADNRTPGAATAVVVGSGFTGLETAAAMGARLGAALGPKSRPRVVLVEREPEIAPEFGPDARAVIEKALACLGTEVVTSNTVVSVDGRGVVLGDGAEIEAGTVIWAGGVRARPIPGLPPGWYGPQGRLDVGATLRVPGLDGIWAAGDAARASVDGSHDAMMCCQHAMPQGKYAGYNAMSWLGGSEEKPYEQRLYVTCLDLGPWGALLTTGFGRNKVVAAGPDAKRFKRYINTSAIYPPLDGQPESLLAAAGPPAGGRVASAVLAKVIASSTARSAVMARAVDGPAALGQVLKTSPILRTSRAG
jgi:NADH dehydrogenase